MRARCCCACRSSASGNSRRRPKTRSRMRRMSQATTDALNGTASRIGHALSKRRVSLTLSGVPNPKTNLSILFDGTWREEDRLSCDKEARIRAMHFPYSISRYLLRAATECVYHIVDGGLSHTLKIGFIRTSADMKFGQASSTELNMLGIKTTTTATPSRGPGGCMRVDVVSEINGRGCSYSSCMKPTIRGTLPA